MKTAQHSGCVNKYFETKSWLLLAHLKLTTDHFIPLFSPMLAYNQKFTNCTKYTKYNILDNFSRSILVLHDG